MAEYNREELIIKLRTTVVTSYLRRINESDPPMTDDQRETWTCEGEELLRLIDELRSP